MTTKKTKPVEPPMTLEEMRAALDGEEKQVFLTLSKAYVDTPAFLKDKTPDEIATYLKTVAAEADFPQDFLLNKVTTENEGPYWVLVAYEAYSDAELLEKGAKLVAAKKKRDAAALKKLQKKVDDYNVRARELGQPTITIADVS